MSSVYRETISDARLKAVADHVRAWLFTPPAKEQQTEQKADAAADVDSASPARRQ
jgi:hypothetical protein